MVQQAVPIATTYVPAAHWNLSGAATFHEALDEGVDTPDNGATQAFDRDGGPLLITIPEGGPGSGKAPWFEVLLAPLEDPGVTAGHVIRIRYKIGQAAWPSTSPGLFTLYQGSGLGPGEVQVVRKSLPDPGTTGWFTYEATLNNTQAGRITDYTDLRLEVQTNTSWSPSLFRVSTVDLLVPSLIQRVHGADIPLRVASDLSLAAPLNLEQDQATALWRDQLRHLVVNLEADGITHTWQEAVRHLVRNHGADLEAASAAVKTLALRGHRVQDHTTPTWREHDMQLQHHLETALDFDLAQKDLPT